jgi:predicted NBD/HSP70 family sugar kinase
MFAPDSIVLSGGVMQSANLFLAGIQKIVSEGCKLVPHERAQLTIASLGADTNLIGAACVWHHLFA